jgi:hypothetical protein
MPPSSRRRSTKPASAPLDLEEIEHDPGFRGMLSFLEVPPADRARLLEQRKQAELAIPMGQSPTGDSVQVQPPEGQQPKISTQLPQGVSPDVRLPMDEPPMGEIAAPYIDVEGRGKRRLRFCHTVQDGHTSTEQLAYLSLWNYARKHGRPEGQGIALVDIGLSQLCTLLSTDHKNVKRIVTALREKLAIEIVRQPDYRRAIPTGYRVFDQTRILERRRAAGLVWVVRTRAVRFVGLDAVKRLLAEDAAGESPTGEEDAATAGLAARLNRWMQIDASAAAHIWDACRVGTPDCTEEEVEWFCRAKESLIRSGSVEDPVELFTRTIPPLFADGGGVALRDYRREQARAHERERQRERQAAQMVVDDPRSSDAELQWAREILKRGAAEPPLH